MFSLSKGENIASWKRQNVVLGGVCCCSMSYRCFQRELAQQLVFSHEGREENQDDLLQHHIALREEGRTHIVPRQVSACLTTQDILHCTRCKKGSLVNTLQNDSLKGELLDQLVTPIFCFPPCLEEHQNQSSSSLHQQVLHEFLDPIVIYKCSQLPNDGVRACTFSKGHRLCLISFSEIPIVCQHFILTHHNIWRFCLVLFQLQN